MDVLVARKRNRRRDSKISVVVIFKLSSVATS